MTLPVFWRKAVLVTHVLSSVGFLGAVVAFLALAVLGAGAASPIAAAAYLTLPTLTWWVLVPFAGAALLLGILQSLTTPWGLFRYYWVIVKLVLTGLALVVLLLQTQVIDVLAHTAAIGAFETVGSARFSMILHATGGLVVLLVATVLSVYKPRGLTRYGAAKVGR